MNYVVLDVAQGLILVFSSIVVFLASRTYRRAKTRAMLLLALGFAFVGAGALVAGILFNLAGSNFVTVETIQACSQAVGFFVIVYSLVGTEG